MYLTTNDGIRKINGTSGEAIWHYTPPYDMNNEPVLMGDHVYGNTADGHAFALDMETGKPAWVTRPADSSGSDVGYPAAFDGLYVMGADKGHHPTSAGGNERVIAIDGKSGETVWSFKTDVPVWNVMPLFPGDDTTLFMDFIGGVYCVGLHNGTLMWHSRSEGAEESFSDGGVILGPNRVAYTCSNPHNMRGGEGTVGIVRAVSLDGGKELWKRETPSPCNSWPVVGRLGDSEDLSVVVVPGSFMGSPNMHGSMLALDAATGGLQWAYQTEPYDHVGHMAVGDLEGMGMRKVFDPRHVICLPAHWSAPSIAGDGTVYVGRSDGKLYAVRGPQVSSSTSKAQWQLGNDFKTTPGVEASIVDMGGSSLHGAIAFAPGMMAFSSCDTLSVWRF